MDESLFKEECLNQLDKLKEWYRDFNGGDKRSDNDSFKPYYKWEQFQNLYCVKLGEAITKLTQEIGLVPEGEDLRGILYIHSECQDVFEEWGEIRPLVFFPGDAWRKHVEGFGLDFDEFKINVTKHVRTYKDFYTPSFFHYPLNSRLKAYTVGTWSDIFEPDKYASDYWRWGIPMFYEPLPTGDRYEEIRSYIEDLFNEPNELNLLNTIYKKNIEKMKSTETGDNGEFPDSILRYSKIDCDKLTPREKGLVLKTLILSLPKLPVVGVDVTFFGKPLGTLCVEYVSEPSIIQKDCLEILGEHFLKKVILYSSEAIKCNERERDLCEVFGKDFLELCWRILFENGGLVNDPTPDPLRPFFYSVKHGTLNAEELCLKTAVGLWANTYKGVLKEGSTLLSFRDAERLLFWLDEYRDHLVHSMKVYLLGRVLIKLTEDWWFGNALFREIFDRCDARDSFAKREIILFAWASAAFYHDFTIGLENFDEVTAKFIEKFTTRIPNKVPKITEVQNGFNEWFVGEDVFFAFFKLIFLMIKDKFERIEIPADYHNEKYGKGFPFRDAFVHFLGKGDHGVSAAVSYLSQIFPKLHGMQGRRGGWLYNPLLHYRIAEAMLKHNLAFKTVIGPNIYPATGKNGEVDPKYVGPIYFLPREYDFDFNDNPISFLLALCDTLQDWGRKESHLPASALLNDRIHEVSKRPYGYITQIEHENTVPNEIKISIDYRWLTKPQLEEGKGYKFCPWEEGGKFNQHPDAPEECKQKEFDPKDRGHDVKCSPTDKVCRVFLRCFSRINEVVMPRFHFNNDRKLIINITYEGHKVEPYRQIIIG